MDIGCKFIVFDKVFFVLMNVDIGFGLYVILMFLRDIFKEFIKFMKEFNKIGLETFVRFVLCARIL